MLRFAGAGARSAFLRASPRILGPSVAAVNRWQPAIVNSAWMARTYGSGPPPLTREFVQERILGVLSNCDKVDESKLTPTAKFSEDLGLDSLDVVDALFFIEEEFTIQMPDHEADEIKSVDQAVEYILRQPDAY